MTYSPMASSLPQSPRHSECSDAIAEGCNRPARFFTVQVPPFVLVKMRYPEGPPLAE